MVTGLPCVCNIDNLTTIKQSTYYHCAAACIKMCTQTERSQEDIFLELHAATNEKDLWYAEPDSVFTYLGKYESIERTSEDCKDSRDATEKIISSFATSKKSAPMLVLGGKHWVLYSGYQMNEKGELKGIYIRDPWPTAAPLTFYPFSDYFFNEYFCAIDVMGKLRGCVESFITSGTKKIFGIDVIKKPKHGGSNIFNDIYYFKKDIIREDLQNYGFTNIHFVKNGGGVFPDCTVNDVHKKPKFLLSFLEVEGNLSLAAIDVEKNLVVGVSSIPFGNCKWYNKADVVRLFESEHGMNISEDEVEYIYDKQYCKSCFDPLIAIRGNRYYLNLEQIVTN